MGITQIEWLVFLEKISLTGALLLPIVFLLINNVILKKKYYSNLKLFFILYIIVYALMMTEVESVQMRYELEVAKYYSFPGDMTPSETGPEFQEDMHNLIADVGRIFAPITRIFLSCFYILFVYLLFFSLRKVVRQLRTNNIFLF